MTLQERIESHPFGRSMITALLLVTLIAMIVSNLPSSELRRTGMRAARPYLDLTGLHQNWNLFAPDPRRVTLGLEARITYGDGATVTWRPPGGDPIFGVYASFRWRKWASYVVDRSDDSRLWVATASWIARTHERDGRFPTQVQLIRRSYVAPRPGSGDTRVPPWQEQVLINALFRSSGASE